MSEYVEFYGDHVFLVQMIPNIAQISIFTNFLKNRIFYIFFFKGPWHRDTIALDHGTVWCEIVQNTA